MDKRILKYYIKNRPFFIALVRSQEVTLFKKNAFIKNKVLDFGCGDGFFLQTLHKYASTIFRQTKIIGLDISNQALAEAKELNTVYENLLSYNGINIHFKENSFDTVFSNCVFEHLPYINDNLAELCRVLKPGGKLYTTVMTDCWENYLTLSKSFWRKIQDHCNLLSKKEWEDLFQKKGFKMKNQIGYLNKEQTRLIEWSHFISLPYLISKKLVNDWSRPGSLYLKLLPIDKIAKQMSISPSLEESAAIFFELEKL